MPPDRERGPAQGAERHPRAPSPVIDVGVRSRGRIVLHFLPPYCPDSNRIERVWQDFHANVTRNHRCKTLNRLLDNARHYLDAYCTRDTGFVLLLRRLRELAA